MMRKTKILFLLAAGIITALSFSSCKKDTSVSSDSMYVPTAADATATATLADLQAGRTLYINSCGNCHGLYLPETYSATQWRNILPNMTPRTGLSPSEISQLTKYVTKGK